ncbi:MAG: chemotaxis protein CheW [Pseudomonadales bacterium]|nr:chemotaxis protein CheW [Pseudomonadales bacterium]
MSDELPTFLVQLQKSNLLVPNATVAEIIPYEPLQRIPDSPDWLLGILGWRGVQVPVISFEMLTVRRGSFSLVSVASASLVILKALGGREDLRFFAIVAQTLPRLMRVTPDQLFATGESPEQTELVRARLRDEVVAIPDLEFVERSIRDALAEAA